MLKKTESFINMVLKKTEKAAFTMFYRKIYDEFNKWKEANKIKKRALVIKGLRQIGKTTVVLEYAKNNYQNVIYINFMTNRSLKDLFNENLEVDELIKRISAAIPNSRFTPNDTVIIFDELQECANARASIKPFMLDGRFDIIATGSLIGLRGYNKKQFSGIPTGFEYIVTMYPMDFEEYLLAKGINKETIGYLTDCYLNKKKIDQSIHENMSTYFKEYLCIGGMPDAVNTFLLTHDMNQVHDVLTNILEQYKDDFGKHLNEKEDPITNKTELRKIEEIYKSIPKQLAKENKKFQYKVINKNAVSRDYREAITWLEEFGLIKLCFNLNSLELPLAGNASGDIFKIYVADSGLFVAMLEEGSMDNIINGDFKIYNGAIYENIVAEAFVKNSKSLYYYNKNSETEIDFITKVNNELTLIEVKANNGSTKSLKDILSKKGKYNVNKAIKLVNGNIGYQEGIFTVPHYLAFLIK